MAATLLVENCRAVKLDLRLDPSVDVDVGEPCLPEDARI